MIMMADRQMGYALHVAYVDWFDLANQSWVNTMAGPMDGGIASYWQNPSESLTKNYRDNNRSYFIENNKTWNRNKLNNSLPKYVVNKIMNILIRMSDIRDKII